MSFKNAMLLFNRPVMRRYFCRTLASYLLIVMLSGLAFFPVVWYVQNMVQEVRIQGEYDDSAAAMDNLTHQIQTIQETFLYLSGQKGFDRVSLIQGGTEPRDYIAMNNARAFLASISGANSLIEDIVVAFYRNDIVLTSRCVFDSRASFEALYAANGLTDALDSLSGGRMSARTLLFRPEIVLALPETAKESRVIPLCMPLSNRANPVNAYGNIVVLLSSEQIEDMLFSPSVQESGLYEITDAAGNHLAGTNPFRDAAAEGIHARETDGGTEYARFGVRGELLRANIGIPTAAFFRYARPVLWIMLRYILLGMLAGILASLHSAASASRPVRRILMELGKSGTALDRGQNAYQLILRSIDDMLEKNSRLHAVSEAARDERLRRQLDRLIAGCGGEEIDDERIPERSALCYALYRPSGERAASGGSLSMLLTDYVSRILPEGMLLHPLTSEGFLLLGPCESEAERERFAAFLTKLFEETGRLFGVELCGAVGPLCLHAEEISRAFESAKLLYYARRNLGEGPVWVVPRTDRMNTTLTISGQTELFHLLLSGKCEEACGRIRQAFLDSVGENTGMEQVFYTLRLVLLLAMEQQNASFALRRYRPNVTPEENIATLLTAARSLCDRSNESKRSHNEQLRKRILSCIEERFADPELCNVSIAEAAGISEKYLCSFVKEQTGRTVSDLLQSKRVAQAHALLAGSEKPINTIWQLSGFSSHNTFYKTIKRVYGMSPSELRAAQGGVQPCNLP